MASGGKERVHTYRPDFDLDRVRGFSDCVFAVAITIVVVTFQDPPRDLTGSALTHYLLTEWPRYLSYVAAFTVIGYYWISHHRLFDLLVRANGRALALNLVLLSFVVLTPFPMQVLGAYRNLPLAHALFDFNAFLIGLLFLGFIVYACRGHRLTSSRLTAGDERIIIWRAAVLPLAFLIAATVGLLIGPGFPFFGLALVVIGRLLVRWRLGGLEESQIEAEGDLRIESETVDRAERIEVDAAEEGEVLPWSGALQRSGSITRLVSFSDNVYAFAITALVLQLKLPTKQLESQAALLGYLDDLLDPDLVGYFVGFAVIGLFWAAHNRVFLLIDRQDSTLRIMNLVHLLFIAVMPFATLVFSTFDHDITPIVVFAVGAGCASLSFTALLWYATRQHRLVDPALPRSELHERRMFSLVSSSGFFLSIPVAFINPLLAVGVWLLPFVGVRVFQRLSEVS